MSSIIVYIYAMKSMYISVHFGMYNVSELILTLSVRKWGEWENVYLKI